MNISIRKAEKGDLSRIHELVVELAIYENEPNAVTASLKDYQDCFEQGTFESIVAIDEKEIVGIMIYYMTFSTWKGKMLYLEDFVVTKAYRRKGVGKLLFSAFQKVAIEKKAVLTKWQVLDWNSPAISFYEEIGATIDKDWYNCKLYL